MRAASGRVASAGRTTRTVHVAARLDARALRDAKHRQLVHILRTYNKAHSFFPRVKFVLRHNSRLGEVWKVTGSSQELGDWTPEVSPTLQWSEGGVWSTEVALPPGRYTFKSILRTADGSYVWEGGHNRHIEVPVKERAGHYVITVQMDVRTEPVEPLDVGMPSQQQQRYSRMDPQLDPFAPVPAQQNGRRAYVPA